jgi:outer membrane protein, heavy metal efflux system
METHFFGSAHAHPCTAAQIVRARRASLAIALASALTAGAVKAETAPAYSVLFRQAEASAPRLAESQANVRAAEGRAQQAGLRRNPSLGLEVENLGTSGNSGGNAAVQRSRSASRSSLAANARRALRPDRQASAQLARETVRP